MNLERRIGFHVKSLDEVRRIANLKGANLMEIKPSFFKDRDCPELYTYENGIFKINHDTAKEIKDVAEENNMQVNLHLPYARKVDINEEDGLCQALKEHQSRILQRYEMLSDLYNNYKIGEIVTVHPPTYMKDGKLVAEMRDAKEHGRELYFALDELIREKGFKYKIGIENMPDPKRDSADLGYEVKHLKHLLGETENIGLTVDTGHRLLADKMSIAKLFALAPVVNMHFHSNPGIFSHENYDDDEHKLATVDNLKNFDRYLTSIRRNKIPVVCEVSHLERIDNKELEDYVEDLRVRLS